MGDGVESFGGPWGEYVVPFVFSANGRPYLKQLETQSGIWFRDARRRLITPALLLTGQRRTDSKAHSN